MDVKCFRNHATCHSKSLRPTGYSCQTIKIFFMVPEFKKRYLHEFKENKELVSILKEQIKKRAVTFVYSAKDETQNEALVLLSSF